jgi:hypothetical protein
MKLSVWAWAVMQSGDQAGVIGFINFPGLFDHR